MFTVFGIHTRGLKFLFPFLIFIISFRSEASVPDTNRLYLTTIFIGHINSPNSLDTVIGTAGKNREFLPRYILWGRDTSNHLYPDSLKVAQTLITYPNWSQLKVKCNIDFLNADTLSDLMFIMCGKTAIDSTHFKDTLKTIIVFGQRGLDTLALMNFLTIDTLQYAPFAAVKLRMGSALTDCKLRDFSHIPSYVVNNINKPEFESPIGNSVVDKIKPNVKIYPNPAVYYTNLEFNQIEPGNYFVEIVSVNGLFVNQQRFEVQQTDNIINKLDLYNIASGIYYLKVHTANGIIGTYPLIIIH